MKPTLLLTFLLLAGFAFAQSDSTRRFTNYSADYKFFDGFYLNIFQFKVNKPVPKSRIVTSLNLNDIEFFEKITAEEFLYIYDNMGVQQSFEVKNIWGYCKNGVIYINWNGYFNRIPIVGNICHFVADYTTYYIPSDPYNVYNPYSMHSTSASTETRQYILDVETGKVMDFDFTNIETILMRDPELYDEFNELKRSKKRKLQFFYLRRYNERNPLMLPIINE